MSAADYAPIRARLQARMSELTKRDAALNRHLRGQDGRNDADFSDRVAYTEMDEVLEQLDEQARDELRAIHVALQRIEAGDYGTCDGCGDPIPLPRLEILPHARFCVSCEE